MRYANAPAAVDWLEKAFGFSRQMVVSGPDGTIAHAQLTCASGMILLGFHKDDLFALRLQPPRHHFQELSGPAGERIDLRRVGRNR